MSHILDALQKVQDEKTAKLKQSTITAGILLEPSAHRQNGKRLYLLVGTTIAVISIAAVGIWLSLKPSKPDSRRTLQNVAIMQPPPPPPPALLPPVPVAAPLPAMKTPPMPPPMQAIQQQPTLEEEAGKRSSARQKQKKAAETREIETRPALSSAPEGVKLTGIAWQDNRNLRRAVVNDILVGEGAVVADAKVLEIKPNVVRFEKNGSLFEVTLPR